MELTLFSDAYITGEYLRVKGIIDDMPRYTVGRHNGVQVIREYSGIGSNIVRREARVLTERFAAMRQNSDRRAQYSEVLNQLRSELSRRNLSIPADFRMAHCKSDYNVNYWEQLKPCSNPRVYTNGYYDDYGYNVRSRGEMIVGNALKALGLEAKYEPGFIRSGARKIIPDYSFPVRIIDRCFFIEFMGMTDDEGYIEYNYGKTEEYMRCGILPGRDLILICGTKDWLPSQATIMHIVSSFINTAVYSASENNKFAVIQQSVSVDNGDNGAYRQ